MYRVKWVTADELVRREKAKRRSIDCHEWSDSLNIKQLYEDAISTTNKSFHIVKHYGHSYTASF